MQWEQRGPNIILKFNLKPLADLIKSLTRSAGYELLIEAMVFRYKQFSYDRFRRLSKGGGEWPPLSRSRLSRKKNSGKWN